MNFWTKRKTTATRRTSAATSRPTSPCSCATASTPWAGFPSPRSAVYTNACNTYIKWAEIWERMYQIPIFTLDVPGTRLAGTQTWPGDPDFENDRRYVKEQIRS